MSRSGEQLYVVDKYSEDDPRPLLEIMADPRTSFSSFPVSFLPFLFSAVWKMELQLMKDQSGSVFYHGLEKFERLSLFAAAYVYSIVPQPSPQPPPKLTTLIRLSTGSTTTLFPTPPPPSKQSTISLNGKIRDLSWIVTRRA